MDEQYLIETLAIALRVDLGEHGLTELVQTAADELASKRARVFDLERKVAELIQSLTRCGVAVGMHAKDSPDEVACRVESRVAELQYLGKSDAVTLSEVREWMGVEAGKPVLTAVIAASRDKARVAELEPKPIATAPRTGVPVRAWDRCVGGWVDIRWKDDGWVHGSFDRFEISETACPTSWRFEPDQSGKGGSDAE